MSSSICWRKCKNKVVYFYCKYEQRKGNDQKKECSEREYTLQPEYILQSGTFILLSRQDLHYLFSHMEFISEKKIVNWISLTTDSTIITSCISFTVVISNFSSFYPFFFFSCGFICLFVCLFVVFGGVCSFVLVVGFFLFLGGVHFEGFCVKQKRNVLSMVGVCNCCHSGQY